MTTLRAASGRVDAVLQQSAEPIFLLGADCQLQFVNRAWEELTGHSSESILGTVCRLSAPIASDTIGTLASCFAPPPEALAGRSVASLTRIPDSEGVKQWRRVEFWPLRSGAGQVQAWIGIVRDPDEPSATPLAESQKLRFELLEIRHRLERRYGIESLVGRGPAHERLLAQIRVAAESQAPVTLIGEAGTGKRSIARVIHQCCSRKNLPFVPFDCRVLPPEVLERELLDSAQKPLADSARPGSARAGTVLLINATDLHRDLQARLVERARGDFRLIATSRADLEEALGLGRIRPDFYYALSTFVIKLRPLRDRVDEIALLAQHFLERANQRGFGMKHNLDDEANQALFAYDWPGNLPELARVIDAAHSASATDSIGVDDLPAEIRGHQASAYLPAPPQLESLDQLLTQVERQLIEQTLAWTRQNKSKAADVLGISRPRLYRRIKELGIPEEGETPLNENANDDHPGS